MTPLAFAFDFRRVPLRHLTPARTVAIGIAVLAVVAYQAWWALVFVAFAAAIAALERPAARRAEIVRTAVAMGGTAVLGVLAIALLALGDLIETYGCIPELVCPASGPALRLASLVAAILAVIGLGTCVWLLRQPGRGHRALSAVNIVFFVLFGVALLVGAGLGNALVEIASITAATGALAVAIDQPRALRLALLAQVADLATFGTVWQLGAGEQNPLGRWTMQALFHGGVVNGAWTWEAAAVTGLLLILAKIGLIGFLIKATPHLGRYSQTVLLAAALVGAIGAAANALVILT